MTSRPTSEVVTEDPEAEADSLRLDIDIVNDKNYDLETTNKLEQSLGLDTNPIQRRWYRDKDPLGSGAFGVVFRQCWKQKGEKEEKEVRVVKVIEKDKIRPKRHGKTKIEGWKPELRALIHFSQLDYQDAGLFVYFHGWYDTLSRVMLVMEWIPHGNLEKWAQVAGGKLPEKDVVEIAAQIFRGLQYMHSSNFAHRDLKPENILIERGAPDWWIKLADFGFTKEVTKQTMLQTIAGTAGYMAPEMTHNDDPDNSESSQYSLLVDIWSAGCVIFRLLIGSVPENVKGSKFHSNISQFLNEVVGGLGISTNCISALEGMLQREARNRLTAEDALGTAWISIGATLGSPTRPRRGTCQARTIPYTERQWTLEFVKSRITNRQTSIAQLLHEAACHGNVELVDHLLKLGLDANTVLFGVEPKTALASLAGTMSRDIGDWRRVMDLLCEGGCDVNKLPEDGTGRGVTALFAACRAGLDDRLQYLMGLGAARSLRRPCKGLSPLQIASQGPLSGHTEVLSNLLELPGLVADEARVLTNPTALHLAVQYGRVGNIRLLLVAGTDINRRTLSTLRAPLHIAVVGMGSVDSIPAIKQAERLAKGQTPGSAPTAYLEDSLKAMELLLEPKWGADIHVRDSQNMTPLHYAAKYSLTDFANKLIQATEGESENSWDNDEILPRPGPSGTHLSPRAMDDFHIAYRIAWEAAKAEKQQSTIADRLERYVNATERELRKKATKRNFFKRLLPSRDNVYELDRGAFI